MNNNGLDQKEIWEYAQDIIVRTPSFRGFAVAMMDFMGGVTDEVFGIYNTLRSINLPSDVILDDPMVVADYNTSNLTEWYEKFLEEQQKKFEEDKAAAKADIDELQYLIEGYRNSEDFHKMLDFVGRFPYLAPYNAMLVELQKPGASFVFPARRWMTEYNRQPKPNAKQLLTLVPFGPVQVMFDFDDTEQIPGTDGCAEKADLMKQWQSDLVKTQGNVDPKIWDNLLDNLPRYGIRYDDDFIASNSYGGYLLKTDKHSVTIKLNNVICEQRACFVLSVNKNLTQVSAFHTICHELGHLFCRHLFYDRAKVRKLSHKEEEFEAETVAWLICKRHGIYNPSEEYLAWYSRDGKIPTCSLDAIMKAVTEIERMLGGIVPIKKTLWYANDENFKDFVDKVIKSLKDKPKVRTLFDM